MFVRLAAVFTVLAALTATPSYGQVRCEPDQSSALQIGASTCDAALHTLSTALRLKAQGWRYIPPRPKSPQAAPSNPDRRTTWYLGYWRNIKTGAILQHVPKGSTPESSLALEPIPQGRWSTRGSPPPMTLLQMLLSLEHTCLP